MGDERQRQRQSLLPYILQSSKSCNRFFCCCCRRWSAVVVARVASVAGGSGEMLAVTICGPRSRNSAMNPNLAMGPAPAPSRRSPTRARTRDHDAPTCRSRVRVPSGIPRAARTPLPARTGRCRPVRPCYLPSSWRSAAASSGWSNANPASSKRRGTTRWPESSVSSPISPNIILIANSGTVATAGRCNTLPSV